MVFFLQILSLFGPFFPIAQMDLAPGQNDWLHFSDSGWPVTQID